MKKCLKSALRIGLISDTHGNAGLLRNAADTLLLNGADILVHLGDFCDSGNHWQMAEVFALLEHYGIYAVKGNNDYQVEKKLQNEELPQYAEKSAQWLRFLQQTPIVRRFAGICCCHSMPYDTVRAFYDPVDTGGIDRAIEVFNNAADHVIFCGHSHNPVVFRWKNGHVTRTAMTASARTLSDDQRYIVIVGAAENLQCGVFDVNRLIYERINISAPGFMETADERARIRYTIRKSN